MIKTGTVQDSQFNNLQMILSQFTSVGRGTAFRGVAIGNFLLGCLVLLGLLGRLAPDLRLLGFRSWSSSQLSRFHVFLLADVAVVTSIPPVRRNIKGNLRGPYRSTTKLAAALFLIGDRTRGCRRERRRTAGNVIRPESVNASRQIITRASPPTVRGCHRRRLTRRPD